MGSPSGPQNDEDGTLQEAAQAFDNAILELREAARAVEHPSAESWAQTIQALLAVSDAATMQSRAMEPLDPDLSNRFQLLAEGARSLAGTFASRGMDALGEAAEQEQRGSGESSPNANWDGSP